MSKIKYILMIGIVVIAFSHALPAEAAKFGFVPIGKEETIHKIVSIDIKGEHDERLFLGYKTTILYFILGVYVTDDGYVIGIEHNKKGYYPLPTGDELTRYQAMNLIPKPLPEYHVSILTYMWGYSLWLLLIVTFIFQFILPKFLKNKSSVKGFKEGAKIYHEQLGYGTITKFSTYEMLVKFDNDQIERKLTPEDKSKIKLVELK